MELKKSQTPSSPIQHREVFAAKEEWKAFALLAFKHQQKLLNSAILWMCALTSKRACTGLHCQLGNAKATAPFPLGAEYCLCTWTRKSKVTLSFLSSKMRAEWTGGEFLPCARYATSFLCCQSQIYCSTIQNVGGGNVERWPRNTVVGLEGVMWAFKSYHAIRSLFQMTTNCISPSQIFCLSLCWHLMTFQTPHQHKQPFISHSVC